MTEIISSLYATIEGQFIIKVVLCLFFGSILGLERQSKGKDAGIRTYSYVILGAMIFSFLSELVDPNSTSRIAAQIVTGIGFLGAGLIIKDSGSTQVRNLTTAASIWYAGGIGMIIGFGYYSIAGLAAITTFAIPFVAQIINKYAHKTNKETIP